MTRKYELLYVLNPEIGDAALETQCEKIKSLLEKNGTILDADIWGRKRLAYEINDLKDGYYVLLHFNSNPEFPEELERQLKINDSVIRYMLTRVEE